jgi:hypothetical protein
VYTDYALNGNEMAVERLAGSLEKFERRYLSEKAALSKRLKVDDRKLSAGISQLQGIISKLDKPVLIELDDGNLLVIDIDHRELRKFMDEYRHASY